MSSSKHDSDHTPQTTEVKKALTPEEKAALRERVAALPSPEEMKQKLQQLLEYSREIVRISEMLLDEKHS